MLSTKPTDGAPLSRASARRRGRAIAALGFAFALLVRPLVPAGAARVPCFPECDPMNPATCCTDDCLNAPCDAFRDCQVANRDAVTECVENDCLGRGLPGNCTSLLECSRNCQTLATNCTKALQSSLESDCGDCRIGRGSARRACNRCKEKAPPACQIFEADTTGSRCQKECIRRQQWIGECYGKCDDRCAGDRCAFALCRGVCRDSICAQLRTQCVGPTTAGDLQYRKCCRTEDCSKDALQTILCETTTSTTSSTSTSRTIQTTTTSVTTTTSSTIR